MINQLIYHPIAIEYIPYLYGSITPGDRFYMAVTEFDLASFVPRPSLPPVFDASNQKLEAG